MATKTKSDELTVRALELWKADYKQCRTGTAFMGCFDDFEQHARMVHGGETSDAGLAAKLADVRLPPKSAAHGAYMANTNVQKAFLDADDFEYHVGEVEAGNIQDDPHAEHVVRVSQLERERDDTRAKLARLEAEGVVPASTIRARDAARVAPHVRELAI